MSQKEPGPISRRAACTSGLPKSLRHNRLPGSTTRAGNPAASYPPVLPRGMGERAHPSRPLFLRTTREKPCTATLETCTMTSFRWSHQFRKLNVTKPHVSAMLLAVRGVSIRTGVCVVDGDGHRMRTGARSHRLDNSVRQNPQRRRSIHACPPHSTRSRPTDVPARVYRSVT